MHKHKSIRENTKSHHTHACPVGPKAINPSFDDNKKYEVMFLTILFNKVLKVYLEGGE